MSKKARRKTNIEVLINLMDFSKNGALMQGFIMNALEQQSQAVILHESEPDGWPNMLSWEAWRECAIELNETLNKHYEATI
jgi:hypothetical protein